MAKAKYDVGDILTWSNDDDCYMTAVIVRWHTKSIFIQGISLEQQTDYDAFIKAKGDDFRFIREVPEIVLYNYKVIGHIDISGMPNDVVQNNLIDATAHEFCEKRIPYVILAYWDSMKMNEKNCCYDGRDELEKENRRLKEEIGMQSDKIFELNEKIGRIATNLRKIGFTSEAIRNIIETDMV